MSDPKTATTLQEEGVVDGQHAVAAEPASPESSEDEEFFTPIQSTNTSPRKNRSPETPSPSLDIYHAATEGNDEKNQDGDQEDKTDTNPHVPIEPQKEEANGKNIIDNPNDVDPHDSLNEEAPPSKLSLNSFDGNTSFPENTAVSSVYGSVFQASPVAGAHGVGPVSDAPNTGDHEPQRRKIRSKVEAARRSASEREIARLARGTLTTRLIIPEIIALPRRFKYKALWPSSENEHSRAVSRERVTLIPTITPSSTADPVCASEPSADPIPTAAFQASNSNLSALAAEFVPSSECTSSKGPCLTNF